MSEQTDWAPGPTGTAINMLDSVSIPFPRLIDPPPTEPGERLKIMLKNLEIHRANMRANIRHCFNLKSQSLAADSCTGVGSQLPPARPTEVLDCKLDNSSLISAMRVPRDKSVHRYAISRNEDLLTTVQPAGQRSLSSLLEDNERSTDVLKASYSAALEKIQENRGTSISGKCDASTASRSAPRSDTQPLREKNPIMPARDNIATTNAATMSSSKAVSNDLKKDQPEHWPRPPPSRRTSSTSSQPVEIHTSASCLAACLADSPWRIASQDIVRELGEATLKSRPLLCALRRLADYTISWSDAAQRIRSNRQRGDTDENSRADLASFRDWAVSTLEEVLGPLPSNLQLRPNAIRPETSHLQQNLVKANPRKRKLPSQSEADEDQTPFTKSPIMRLVDSVLQCDPALSAEELSATSHTPAAGHVPTTSVEIGAGGGISGSGGGGSLIDRERDPRRRR